MAYCGAEPMQLEHGVECPEAIHFVCDQCFDQHVATTAEVDPQILKECEGRVKCPCCDRFFADADVAAHVTPAVFEKYDELRRNEIRNREWLGLHEHMMARIREMARRLQQSAPGMTKELLAKQLQKSIPGARMCGRCNHGPIEHFACSDLTAHRSEGFTGNACQKCGWFARSINDWPKWDGNLPDTAVEPVSFEPSADMDSETAQRVHHEEQQRLQQIEDDHALAQRLQRL